MRVLSAKTQRAFEMLGDFFFFFLFKGTLQQTDGPDGKLYPTETCVKR